MLIKGAAAAEPIASLLAFVRDHWEGPVAFVPTLAWLDEYEAAYQPRPHVPLLPH